MKTYNWILYKHAVTILYEEGSKELNSVIQNYLNQFFIRSAFDGNMWTRSIAINKLLIIKEVSKRVYWTVIEGPDYA